MNEKGQCCVVVAASLLWVLGCGRAERGDAMATSDEMKGHSENRVPRDVCGFTKAVALKPTADGGVLVPPSHPDIRYAGRIDCSDPSGLRMSHPGISIRIRVESPSLEVLLEDFGIEEYPNFYNIVVDGGEPTVLQASPERHRYLLATDLPAGAHTIELVRRGESCANGNLNSGKGIFRGFIVPETATILPLSPRPRRLEFIGDSITCGYGNRIATVTPEVYPYSTRNSDATIAYGALVARALDAEYMAVAYSGRGIVRNFAGYPGKTLPEMYFDLLPDDPEPGVWEASSYLPELIVINLGTNDFSEGIDLDELPALRSAYENEYGIFLDTLRRYYPETVFILAVGPSLTDSWPKGVDALTSVRTILTRIVSTRRAAGDEKLYLLMHEPQSPPYGEDWHPTAERHRIMADELLAFISERALL